MGNVSTGGRVTGWILAHLAIVAAFTVPNVNGAPPQGGPPARETASEPAEPPEPPTTSRALLVEPGDLGPKGRPAHPTMILEAAVEPETYSFAVNRGILAREILRQALLIAARDGLGLATRDATLGESTRAEGVGKGVELSTQIEGESHIRVELRRVGGDLTLLASGECNLGPGDILDFPKLVTFAESLSRGPFVDALKRAGWNGGPKPGRSGTRLPAKVDEHLDQLTFTAQFAALRATHDSIRTGGESQRALGALARGYAQLGVLTEFHWNASHKGFKARSLLYAQRLVTTAPESPWGYWHRAFAKAMAGFHGSALADLEEADRRWQALKGDKALAAKVPFKPGWLDVIAAYCRFDTAGLTPKTRKRPTQLAALLRFLTVESSEATALIMETGRDALDLNPENYRIIDSLCELGGIGNLHEVTSAGPETLTRTLPGRVRKMPGLPPDVSAILPDRDEAKVRRALEEAGVPGADGGEPSWSLLGHMIREVRFVQSWRRLRFLRDQWAVPVDDDLPTARALVAGHPYRNYIESFAFDPLRQKSEIARLLKDIRVRDAEPTESPLVYELDRSGAREGPIETEASWHHMETLTRDIMLYLGETQDPGDSWRAQELLAISPHCPFAMGVLIRDNWEFAEPKAADWEKRQGQHPAVVGNLAKRYYKLKRPEDAKRCLKRYIEISPDLWAYEWLSGIYFEGGDPEKWRGTLDAFLQQPNYGLDHMRVRVRIADDLMSRREWKEALPYAEAAAETWAGEGMACAVHCYDGLKDWDKAELWARRMTERYPSHYWTVWHAWCLLRGHGDLKAAELAAAQQAETIGDQATSVDLDKLGRYLLGTRRTRQGIDTMRRLMALPDSIPAEGLQLAAFADEAQDKALCDDGLKHAIRHPQAKPPLVEFCKLLQRWLADGGREALDKAAIDAINAKYTPRGRGTVDFYAGRFLTTHGKPKDAAVFLERCVRNTDALLDLRAIAAGMLREQGIDTSGMATPLIPGSK